MIGYHPSSTAPTQAPGVPAGPVLASASWESNVFDALREGATKGIVREQVPVYAGNSGSIRGYEAGGVVGDLLGGARSGSAGRSCPLSPTLRARISFTHVNEGTYTLSVTEVGFEASGVDEQTASTWPGPGRRRSLAP
jgi:hypothetical protein